MYEEKGRKGMDSKGGVKLRKCGIVMVNIACQFDRIQSHLGDKSLGMSMRGLSRLG